MVRELRIAVLGFGNVGRRFAELLLGPYGRALRGQGVRARATGIATRRHGVVIDPRGVALQTCLRRVRAGLPLDRLRAGPLASAAEVGRRGPADAVAGGRTRASPPGGPAPPPTLAARRRRP